MKFKAMIVAVVASAALYCSNAAQAVIVSTGEVYQISLSASLVHDGDTQGTVVKDTATTSRLINLARGRSTDATVPANERLALVLFFVPDGQPTGAIVVWDANSQSVLADISDLQSVNGVIDAKGKGTVNMVGGFNSVGNLTGGWLAFTGKTVANETNVNHTITSFSASAVQGAIEGNDGQGDFQALITKGKVAVVGYLGILLPL